MNEAKEVKTAEQIYYKWSRRWIATDERNLERAMISAMDEYTSQQNAELKKENQSLQIQVSNYAYQMDRAKQERDTAEAENIRLRNLLSEIDAWLSFNVSPTTKQLQSMRKDIQSALNASKP